MKRGLWLFVLVTALLGFSGCASVQKKFTRKKKEPLHVPTAIYLEGGPFKKKFSNEYYYKSHYTLWKSWHSELIDDIGGNNKKAARSAQEALGNLTELQQYLVPAKQEELKPYLEELTKIKERVEANTYAESEIGGVHTDLERILRLVSSNFYYNKVKDELVPESVDLPAPADEDKKV